eukprot:GHVP01025773.1.p1 GENE.GHVP01025773.1~~GHVP01025773.1.p1  ORF type:complete len:301 (+),score=45.85 GHVP01025773.1:40-942(+)
MTLGEECKFGIVSTFMGAMTGCYTHSPLPDISDASSSQVQGENVVAFGKVMNKKIFQTVRSYRWKEEKNKAIWNSEPKFEELRNLEIEHNVKSEFCNQIREIYDEGIISYLIHYYEIGTCLNYKDPRTSEEPLLCFERKAKTPESHPKAIAASYNKEGSFFTIYFKIGEMILSTAFNCDIKDVYRDPVIVMEPKKQRILEINDALEIKGRKTYYKSDYIGDVYKSQGLPFFHYDNDLYYLFDPEASEAFPKTEEGEEESKQGLNPETKEFWPLELLKKLKDFDVDLITEEESAKVMWEFK